VTEEAVSIKIFYDGDCPFCTSYARFNRLSAEADIVQITNLRELPKEELLEFANSGFNPENGILLVLANGSQTHTFQGAEAMAMLSTLDNRKSVLAMILRVMRVSWAAKLLYPLLWAGRLVLLRLMRISPSFETKP
jgi:predicted DCC family thiol-disulfide oxidoreductase YuxK